jgi:tricorn protease
MSRATLTFSLCVCLSAAAPAAAVEGPTKLLRFPDVHGDQVAFCYAGDLWRAPADGGLAIRLTAHPGQELFPKFSPDGAWIAFTGQYDGDEQVYVMPAAGGVPRQLTYYPARGPLAPRWGYDNQVYGWTPDGERVLFRSLRDADGGRTETALYTVDAGGGLPVMLPMPTAGAGDLSPDGRRIVYSPLFRDFRSWKRYQGGWAQNLYIFDLKSFGLGDVAHSVRTERDPMWIGDAIYFVSDRDGTLNLYSFDLGSRKVRQHTREKTWDVRWASSDNVGRIVYELDGELHLFDVKADRDRKISITVPDDGLSKRPSRYPAGKNIEDFALSPKGERALFVARGDVFTAPIEKGATRNLTNSSGAHDKRARWSPDGARIAFVSDRTGEEQVYLVGQDGSGEAEPITTGLRGQIYTPEWSPDGKRIAISDKEGKVWVIEIEAKEALEIADEKRGRVFDYAWSPGSGFLAFSLSDENGFHALHVWSVETGDLHRVTGPLINAYRPAWDPEGNYLFFLSDREYAPQISQIEWNFAGNRRTGIFALALRRDVKNPFAPESDEVKVGEAEENGKEEEGGGAEKDEEEKKDDEAKEAPQPDRIEFEGIADRVVRVPVEADNYAGLRAIKGRLIYSRSGASFYGRDSYEKPSILIFEMKDRKASTLVAGSDDFALSRDGKKILVSQEDRYQLYDVKPEAKDPKTVSTSGLMVDRVPAEEWAQIFDEIWRRYRDFFYVENLHGYGWKEIGDRYRRWVPYVAHRSDLNYVVSEMISELNVGHAYIQGGDFEIPDRPAVGLPGARFALDERAGRYRIARIFRGQNEEPRYRAPLTEVGVDVKEGDYVLAIDGEELKGSDNPYRLLQHKTDPVSLTVNGSPSFEGARDVVYEPIRSEGNLLYLQWIEENRRKVAEATGGRVGYLHLPDMGADGIYEFIKWFYPQIRLEGLIVDVRSNGGGNVSQWILERLDTKLLGTRFGRLSEDPETYPDTVFHGHLAALINETSASDGDIFPYYFREAGLGPLIGVRTWGGVVGISGLGPLLDGGQVFVPLSGTNAATGEWVIEGHGVDPDIEVWNDPKSVLEGKDPQLERAIREVMQRIQADPKRLPDRPADPVKTR